MPQRLRALKYCSQFGHLTPHLFTSSSTGQKPGTFPDTEVTSVNKPDQIPLLVEFLYSDTSDKWKAMLFSVHASPFHLCIFVHNLHLTELPSICSCKILPMFQVTYSFFSNVFLVFSVGRISFLLLITEQLHVLFCRMWLFVKLKALGVRE